MLHEHDDDHLNLYTHAYVRDFHFLLHVHANVCAYVRVHVYEPDLHVCVRVYAHVRVRAYAVIQWYL